MAVGKFLEKEKINQAEFKSSSKYFSEEARKDGVYRQKSWPFCLPRSHAEENLFEGIRGPAIDFFKSHEIKWHDGENGKPSNHLCDSQVCCVNFLFPFAQNSQALTELLRPLFPNIQKMLPIEDGLFVSFEWIGKENYLNEGNALNGKRTRGANFTSADAAVMFERTDGKRHFVLIEWKYTESYPSTSIKIAKSGKDRSETYLPFFKEADSPIEKTLLRSSDALFFEPFYHHPYR